MCLFPLFIDRPKGLCVRFGGKMLVPCGKCPECRRQRQNSWYIRLHNESLNYPSNSTLFLTLTYDEEHLPSDHGLSKTDCQLFFKRLRQNLFRKYGRNVPIRYFLTGEYGEDRGRPHYHLILFGMPDARSLDTYHLILSSWGCGIVDRKFFLDRYLRYVSKYSVKEASIPLNSTHFKLVMCSKKLSNGRSRSFFKWYNPNTKCLINNNFVMCSKNLGLSWLTKANAYKLIVTGKNTIEINKRKFSLPRYYVLKLRDIASDYSRPLTTIIHSDHLDESSALARYLSVLFEPFAFSHLHRLPTIDEAAQLIFSHFPHYKLFYTSLLSDLILPCAMSSKGEHDWQFFYNRIINFFYRFPDEFKLTFRFMSVSEFLDCTFSRYNRFKDSLLKSPSYRRRPRPLSYYFFGNRFGSNYFSFRNYIIDIMHNNSIIYTNCRY